MKLLEPSEIEGTNEENLILICEHDNVEKLKRVGLEICSTRGIDDAVWIANSRSSSRQELMANGKVLLCIRS